MKAMWNEVLISSFAPRWEEPGRCVPSRRWKAVSRAVQATDWVLRRIYDVHEFSNDPDCLLRISQKSFADAVALGTHDGIGRGATLLELHLWNEHLPPFPPEGPTFAWAANAERMVEHSLRLLARQIDGRPEFSKVCGIHAVTPFASQATRSKLIRLARRYGFETLKAERRSWQRRTHQLASNILIAGLVWTYNPRGLRKSKMIRAYIDLWMSREELLARYGSGRL